MVYASQINADLHVRFFPAATMKLFSTGLQSWTRSRSSCLLDSLRVFQVVSKQALDEPTVDFVNAG